MTFTDKIFSALMVMKIFFHLKKGQRKFFVDTIRRYYKGKETNIGDTIFAIGFNEFAKKM